MIYIFPTDTVYGIGCSIYNKEAQEKIYEIKNRPRTLPLAVLCSDIDQIKNISNINDVATKLINHFMPGELTIIVEAKDDIKKILNNDTVGIRIPNSKLALSILTNIGPMTATSVNDSGSSPMNDYHEIISKYRDKVDMIYPPEVNDTFSKIASTVVDVTKDEIVVIRKGNITLEEILKVIV